MPSTPLSRVKSEYVETSVSFRSLLFFAMDDDEELRQVHLASDLKDYSMDLHSRQIDKIHSHMERRGSKRELRFLRENFIGYQEECVTAHTNYKAFFTFSSPVTEKHCDKWIVNIHDRTQRLLTAIDDHLASRSSVSAASSVSFASSAHGVNNNNVGDFQGVSSDEDDPLAVIEEVDPAVEIAHSSNHTSYSPLSFRLLSSPSHHSAVHHQQNSSSTVQLSLQHSQGDGRSRFALQLMSDAALNSPHTLLSSVSPPDLPFGDFLHAFQQRQFDSRAAHLSSAAPRVTFALPAAPISSAALVAAASFSLAAPVTNIISSYSAPEQQQHLDAAVSSASSHFPLHTFLPPHQPSVPVTQVHHPPLDNSVEALATAASTASIHQFEAAHIYSSALAPNRAPVHSASGALNEDLWFNPEPTPSLPVVSTQYSAADLLPSHQVPHWTTDLDASRPPGQFVSSTTHDVAAFSLPRHYAPIQPPDFDAYQPQGHHSTAHHCFASTHPPPMFNATTTTGGPPPCHAYPPGPFPSLSSARAPLGPAIHQPSDDWIANLGNPAWIDSTRRPTSDIRPVKMQLGKFSGLAKDWPAFKFGFKLIIYDNCRCDEEAMHHLRCLLPQEISDSLGAALLQPEMFAHAMKELETKYGSSQLISRDCLARMLALPSVKEDDFQAFKFFS